jgi:hypothetical protein
MQFKPVQTYSVYQCRKTEHPRYRLTANYDYDYSILELSIPVDFVKMSHVSPICWPSARPMANRDVSSKLFTFLILAF